MSQQNPNLRRELLAPLLAVAVPLAVAILLARPFSEVCVIDDFAFAWSVRNWLETGQFRITEYSLPSLVTMMVYGAAAAKVFGYSMLTLRATTWVMAVLGGLVTYALLREVGGDRRRALIGSAFYALHPLLFFLSNSFMTDVPYSTLSLLAMYAYVRGFRRRSTAWVLAGSAAITAALLVRQFGVLLCLCAVLYSVWEWRRTRDRADALRFVCSALPLLVFLPFQYWFTEINGPGYSYALYGTFTKERAPKLALRVVALIAIAWGIGRAARRWGGGHVAALGGGAVALLLGAGFVVYASRHPGTMPLEFLLRLVRNRILEDVVMRALVSVGWLSVAAGPWMLAAGPFGASLDAGRRGGWLGVARLVALGIVGAALVSWSLGQTQSGEVGYLGRAISVVPSGWPSALRLVCVLSGVVGWFGLVSLMSRLADPRIRHTCTPPWLLVVAGGYALGVAFYNNVTYYFYDRYLLPYLPVVFALSVVLFPSEARSAVVAEAAASGGAVPRPAAAPPVAMLASVGVTALFLAFGVADTSNYFRGQEALWREAAALEARGVPAHHIDAREYSFTRLWHWWRDHREAERAVDMRCDGWLVAVALPVIDRRYALFYEPMDGYRVVETTKFPFWGTREQGTILIQERVTDLCKDTRRPYAGP